MKSYKTGELADLLGVTPQTIRNYVENKQIPYHKTPSNHLYFTESDLKEILGEKPGIEEKWIYYLRSSSGRKSSLENQQKELGDNFPAPAKIIKDSASGLNENRKGLNKLLELAGEGKITHIAITNPDRLARFGRTFIEQLLKERGVTVKYLYPDLDSSPHDELLQDFMSLIASFSGRFYKMRSTENKKKLLSLAEEQLSEK